MNGLAAFELLCDHCNDHCNDSKIADLIYHRDKE